jgi:hypothetical protein
MKLTQSKVLGLLEGSYRNKTHGDNLLEFAKAHLTHGDTPF